MHYQVVAEQSAQSLSENTRFLVVLCVSGEVSGYQYGQRFLQQSMNFKSENEIT